ncbi:MAG: hypothetical protein R2806_05615 [Saprospiraceae bacterium]
MMVNISPFTVAAIKMFGTIAPNATPIQAITPFSIASIATGGTIIRTGEVLAVMSAIQEVAVINLSLFSAQIALPDSRKHS